MILFLITFFILGTAVGSFLNVVVDRTTRKESILGRSYCDHCRAKLSTFDLVPVLSFIGLGAKCRYCKKSLSLQYPIVETLTGVLFALSFWNLASGGRLEILPLLYGFLVISVMIVVAVVDLKFSLIPTTFVFGASLVSLFYNFLFLSPELFINHVIAAFAAALFFLLIVLITWGRGMGQGDIILAFFIGIILGIQATILSIFLGFLTGALVSLLLIVFGRKRFGQTIPFAPFLVFGFLVSFFWASRIIEWYLMVY